MPNTVAMPKSVDAEMNLRASTERTIDRGPVAVKTAEGGDGPDLTFVTTEPPFITDNVKGWSRRACHSRRHDVDSSHSGWLPVQTGLNIAVMLAQGILALSIVVRIHDAYGVPGDQLARAQTTVERIMAAAGVAVAWPVCPCLSPVSSGELVVRIAAASPTTTPGALGFSYVDIQQKAGTLATVFADRVQTMAAFAEVEDGVLLGWVMAHEISHLLIGTRDHEPRGLMRGEWKASELTRQRRSDWLLSQTDGLRIRRAIARRTTPSSPAMLAVDADPQSDVSTQ